MMRTNVSRHGNGFSLVEIVFVLALTSTILYSVALLTQKTLGTLTFLQKKSESILSATLGCERLSSEMREAVTPPTEGGSTEFNKVRPSVAPAIGITPPPPAPPVVAPPPAPPPADFAAWPRSYTGTSLLSVEYGPNNDKLERTIGGVTTVVATSVTDFQVSKVSGADLTYRVSLSVQEQRKLMVFTSYVFCPGAAP